MLHPIITIDNFNWPGSNSHLDTHHLHHSLEQGKVLYFPKFDFLLSDEEKALLSQPVTNPKHKNISLSHDGAVLKGTKTDEATQSIIQSMIYRFQQQAMQFVNMLLPEYQAYLCPAPTSLRLIRVEERQNSWRKDDRRLHVDAFPSRPNYGERILRLFININPQNEPRVWRIGEPFEQIATRFLPTIKPQFPGWPKLQHFLRITKSPRSAYDHLMLNLHDRMKADLHYQKHCEQIEMQFPPSCAWMCFSDQVSHAVMSGQYMMEQTFFIPIHAMVKPQYAPLNILEKLAGKELV